MQRYMTAQYKEGGRGPLFYDCWGLVRIARHELLGLPLLPSYGALDPDNKLQVTRAFYHTLKDYVNPSLPTEGAIATVWRGKVCLHVGLVLMVDGRLGVLEIDDGISPHWQRLSDFESRFLRVEYYNDKNIPEHVTG